MLSINLYLNKFMYSITKISINDVVDILIVAYLCYKILMFIKDTRAHQLFKGVIILLIATQLSGFFKLHTLYWILVKILEVGFILPFIIFQPELRAGLEHLGRNTSIIKFGSKNGDKYLEEVTDKINEMIEAIYSMAKTNTGALIVVEGKTKLNEIVETGTIIEGKITKSLLCNIFMPNTPLHDGAVVVRNLKIKSAGCFLPLTQRMDLNQEIGTRHRAAIGVSEISDCICIVVSEESGKVSITKSGKIYRNITKERLFNILREFDDKRHQNNMNFFKELLKN